MPRRLAVARHTEGTPPVGWVLIGFLMGAAIAILALSHADWMKRLPDAMKAQAMPTAPAPTQVPTPSPAPMVRAATDIAPVPDTQAAVTPPNSQPSAMAAKPSPGEEAQVEEDAAAAGMTSHARGTSADLN